MNSLKRLVYERGALIFRGNPTSRARVCHLSFTLPPGVANLARARHPNRAEKFAILAALREVSRWVVTTDYRYRGCRIPADIVFGFGVGLERSVDEKKPLLYYATGASCAFQTNAAVSEYSRVIGQFGVGCRTGFRVPDPIASYFELAATEIFAIGSAFTSSTFPTSRRPPLRLPGIPLPVSRVCLDDSQAERAGSTELVWVGSRGVLHKGLHIAADVAWRTGRVLHVLGVDALEAKLAQAILARSGCKFSWHGHISPMSLQWARIFGRRLVALGCSVSEGMSTSLLTAIGSGAMCVATDTCGLDVGECVTFHPRETLIDRLSEATDRLCDLSPSDFMAAQATLRNQVRNQNSYERFAALVRSGIRSSVGADE